MQAPAQQQIASVREMIERFDLDAAVIEEGPGGDAARKDMA